MQARSITLLSATVYIVRNDINELRRVFIFIKSSDFMSRVMTVCFKFCSIMANSEASRIETSVHSCMESLTLDSKLDESPADYNSLNSTGKIFTVLMLGVLNYCSKLPSLGIRNPYS